MGEKNVRFTVPPYSDWIPRNTFQGMLLHTFNALGGSIGAKWQWNMRFSGGTQMLQTVISEANIQL